MAIVGRLFNMSIGDFYFAATNISRVMRAKRILPDGYCIWRDTLSEADLEAFDNEFPVSLEREVPGEACERRYVFPVSDRIRSLILSNEEIKKILEKFPGPSVPNSVMRNKIISTSPEMGSGGGWHRDSYRPQIKLFIPLSDITYGDGETQLIRSSGRFRKRLSDSLRGKRLDKYYNALIDPHDIIHFIARRGDIFLLETSMVHRGSPPARAGRDLITVYFNDTFTL